MQTCSKNVTHVIMHVGEIKVYVDMSEFVFAKKITHVLIHLGEIWKFV